MDKELAVVMGNAARQARQARQLTQDQVAKLLGVSVEFYSRLERGRAHPSIETFLRMLDVLDVRADTLLGLDATRAAAPVEIPLTSPDDPRAVRRIAEALQRLPTSTTHAMAVVLKEFERAESAGKRGSRRSRRSREPPTAARGK